MRGLIHFLAVIFVISSITQVNSWFFSRRRRQRVNTASSLPTTTTTTPNDRKSSTKSPTAISATTTLEVVTCASIPESTWLCRQHLNYNCTYSDSIREFKQFRKENKENLDNLTSSLTVHNNPCRNITIEIFCHYFLPKCKHTNNETGSEQCTKTALSQDVMRLFPCEDYCRDVLETCLKEYDEKLSSIFEEENITEICSPLPHTSPCWKNSSGLNETKELLAQKDATKVRRVETTTLSTTPNPQSILTIGLCIGLGAVAIMAATVLIWRCYKKKHKDISKSSDRQHINLSPTGDDQTGPQIVYNEIYNRSSNPAALYSTVVKDKSPNKNAQYEDMSIPDNHYSDIKEKQTENEYAMAAM